MATEKHKRLITIVSIVIPVVVAILFRVKIEGYNFRFLPSIYAVINGATAVLLVLALVFIRLGNRKVHEAIMKVCLGLSGSFLVLYVLYHMTTPATPFGGEGTVRVVYLFILITHIALSIFITPMVLFTFSRALFGEFEKHKALAKFTFPMWLYVAVTGVVIYIMISPYYIK